MSSFYHIHVICNKIQLCFKWYFRKKELFLGPEIFCLSSYFPILQPTHGVEVKGCVTKYFQLAVVNP